MSNAPHTDLTGKGAIDLLVSDVITPQMDGATLIERVRETQPDFKVILISDYV